MFKKEFLQGWGILKPDSSSMDLLNETVYDLDQKYEQLQPFLVNVTLYVTIYFSFRHLQEIILVKPLVNLYYLHFAHPAITFEK